jgi:small acid-soluble spore protein I (minor)
MNLNLRQAVLSNVQSSNVQELKETIQGSIDGEEVVLPGMGVLFELIWKNANSEEQQQLLTILHKSLQAK